MAQKFDSYPLTVDQVLTRLFGRQEEDGFGMPLSVWSDQFTEKLQFPSSPYFLKKYSHDPFAIILDFDGQVRGRGLS